MAEFELKLAQIPWSARETAVGDARHVPAALRELTAADEGTRRRAYWSLDNHVVLQSDLYEAAYDVVPFLLDLLRARPTCGRDLIYDLLFEIANGHAPPGRTCKTREGKALPLRDGCVLAVRTGMDAYEADLADADPVIRAKAAELLELLDERRLEKPPG